MSPHGSGGGKGLAGVTREEVKQAGLELHPPSAGPETKCPEGPDNGETDFTYKSVPVLPKGNDIQKA